jgi:hypothetical protein
MSTVVYDGQIDGEFEGFKDDTLFKLKNGTYWIQTSHDYWYHSAFDPVTVITEEDGIFTLTAIDRSAQVRKITDVIESQIEGDFTGWDGETSYRLVNGQTWKQRTPGHDYKNAYMPEVVIYQAPDGYKMRVAGTVADVERVR